MLDRFTGYKRLLALAALNGGGASIIERTAIGNPLTFLTDLARPLKGLLIPFTPQQEGTGDPSPQNIRSILPWNGLTVYQSGADTSNPTETDIVFPSPVYGGTLDVVSGVLTVEWGVRIETGQSPNSWSSTETATQKRWVLNKGIFEKLPKESSKLFANYFKNSTSPASWNAFFGSTSNFLCYVPLEDFPSKDSWINYLAQNPLTIIYELDEPYEVQLTGEQLTAIVGDNTIWSDADGSMTAVYLLTESFGDDHPISGGLGSGLLGGGFGSGSGEPDEPVEPDEPGDPDQPDEPAEPDQPGEE